MSRIVAPAVAGLSVAVVVALWVGNGGAGQVAGGGWEAVAAAGRLTGLLASDLLLLQVLLLARIPWVERGFGQDRLARWHRWTGFTSFHLMLAHLVLITFGYAGPFDANVFWQFWNLVTTYEGMLLALAGAAALGMVVVTSVRVARRRLRYESWHLLHLYAYLGVGLALPHQLWTGSEFTSSPVASAYWWALYGVAAGAVLVYRVGLPLWRTLRHRLVVAAVEPEAPGITSVYLKGRALDRLPVRAGQFFLWRFLDGPGWTRAHPFSLSGPPPRPGGRERRSRGPAADQDSRRGSRRDARGHDAPPDLLRITVKDAGDGSARVAALRPGTRVAIEGPFGRMTGASHAGEPVTMFACGIGITPLLSLLWDMSYEDNQAILVYRARSVADLAFQSELDALADRRGVRVVPLLGPRAPDPAWLPRAYAGIADAEAMRQVAPDIAAHRVYICGPDAWTAAVRDAARAAGVPNGRIHTERFAW